MLWSRKKNPAYSHLLTIPDVHNQQQHWEPRKAYFSEIRAVSLHTLAKHQQSLPVVDKVRVLIQFALIDPRLPNPLPRPPGPHQDKYPV